MSKHLERDLATLERNLVTLAGAVEAALHKAIRALHERNEPLAQEVIAGDDRIDADENLLEAECVKLLALHQPVAIDLRRITAAMKINGELERMADLAAHIAERVVTLAGLPPMPLPAQLPCLTELTTAVVRQSIDSFIHLDVSQARSACRLDDEVDRCHREIIAELVAAMTAAPALVGPALSLFSTIRHLERIADHGTNIAENVVFLAEGNIVRHRLDAVDPVSLPNPTRSETP